MAGHKGTFVHDLLGAWMILWAWTPMVFAIGAAWRWPSAWSFLFAVVFVGCRQNALFVVAHESWHRNLFRSRRWNDWAGAWLGALPIVQTWAASREEHLEHHRTSGTAADPTWPAYAWRPDERADFVRNLVWLVTGLPFVVRAARSVFGRYATAANSARTVPRAAIGRADLVPLLLCQAVVLCVFAATVGWWRYVVFWLWPAVAVHQAVDELRQFLEHRSGRLIVYRSSAIGRFLLGSFNFHLHGWHHIASQEPWFDLPGLDLASRRRSSEVLVLPGYGPELWAYFRGRVRPEEGVIPAGAGASASPRNDP